MFWPAPFALNIQGFRLDRLFQSHTRTGSIHHFEFCSDIYSGCLWITPVRLKLPSHRNVDKSGL
jgi:hypothetical protein